MSKLTHTKINSITDSTKNRLTNIVQRDYQIEETNLGLKEDINEFSKVRS